MGALAGCWAPRRGQTLRVWLSPMLPLDCGARGCRIIEAWGRGLGGVGAAVPHRSLPG